MRKVLARVRCRDHDVSGEIDEIATLGEQCARDRGFDLEEIERDMVGQAPGMVQS